MLPGKLLGDRWKHAKKLINDMGATILPFTCTIECHDKFYNIIHLHKIDIPVHATRTNTIKSSFRTFAKMINTKNLVLTIGFGKEKTKANILNKTNGKFSAKNHPSKPSSQYPTRNKEIDSVYESVCNWDVLALQARNELRKNISVLKPCIEKMVNGKSSLCWWEMDRFSMTSDFSEIGKFVQCLKSSESEFELWRKDDNELLVTEIQLNMKRMGKLLKQGESLASESAF